ncbi:MAG: SEC-C metal-binding domain-containing protein, partial [Campylobacter hyointestinalis]
ILKTGIGLRGYNQKDPLTEYKKESYNLFMELVSRLKNESIKTLQIVRFKTEQDEALNNSIEKIKKSEESQISEVPKSKKPTRNEPCPCGSGKKYKDCCGKSGPKKGMFA